ncbi:GntR family transcriptional regulator [Lacrimispora sp. 210928-DFI.3.58]|uniref:GntR family transcriptional regulator n=1 Tax=Lacrimispora sp. 210928-DFI.3.58 TaxID=2883214 RepID=UPI001D071829|nr:GntR family transcriptional regulator [Lacrimispora sp. 210928-DFI.3.58]MCB7318277.1 GntR family transcriptional regulator [Lacrimispora sp. 210928-DFI.3.58]
MEQVLQRSEEVTRRLLEELRVGRYADEEKLPPEVILAEQMGVSRTLLRDCLAILEREGFISRKHGVGTVINKHVLDVVTRMDLEKEFLEMVEDAGYTARIDFATVAEKPCPEETALKLHLEPGEMIFQVTRLISADGRPAIYCVDQIGMRHLKTESYDIKELEKPIFCFLEKYCGESVYMDLTEVRAVASDETLSGIFKIDQGTPVLYMDEVGYNFRGEPVLMSKEYYMDGILQHKVLRKKI